MRSVGLGLGLCVLVSFVHAQTPAINAGGVVNAGSYAAGGVAPGSIVAIFGTNLAGSLAVASSIPLSTSLGDVSSVTFNGVAAPFYFVSGGQINAQLPWNVLPSGTTSGTATVVLTRSTGTSAPQSVNIVASMPGIFTVSQNGLGQAIATDNNDGAIAAPSGSIAGVNTHPISLSSKHALIIWCTGVGPVTPSIANGVAAGSELRNTVAQPEVLIGGVQAQFVYSVLSPQYVSENQIGVVPAPNTPTGNAVPLQIKVNGITTSDKVTIAVTN
jgi:uncharacterized protein (TIGR03437 family)